MMTTSASLLARMTHSASNTASAAGAATGDANADAGVAEPGDTFGALLQGLGEALAVDAPSTSPDALAAEDAPTCIPMEASAIPIAAEPAAAATAAGTAPGVPPTVASPLSPAQLLALASVPAGGSGGTASTLPQDAASTGGECSGVAAASTSGPADRPQTSTRPRIAPGPDGHPGIAQDADTNTARPSAPSVAGNDFAAAREAGTTGRGPESSEAAASALHPGAAHGPSLPHAAAVANANALPDASATPAAPAHRAALFAHPLDAAFPGELASEVRLLVAGGVQTAELRLNPAELGPIRIELALSEGRADMSFAAASETTRAGIAQALPALREMLAEGGLSLGDAGIGAGAHAHDGHAQQRAAQASASHAHRQGGGQEDGATDPGSAGAVARAASPGAGRGMLDLYA
ncbi:flagellar hook-length control protein FliK [Ramlibacter sp.]|uniref:flagellar hook-length control protein FliK n=1 Tax=Ramlibacter sp. TaxID=1917967 RepID=UPI003D0ED8D7